MKLFASKKKESTRLVCVVTSYAAMAAVVRTYNDDGATAKPVVVFSSCQPIHARHGRDEKLLNEIACGALRAVTESCRAFHGKFDDIVCTIGEPWTTTVTRSIHMDRAEPFKLTQKIIDEMIARDRKSFEQTIVGDIGLVQVSQSQIALNGYLTNDIIGQKPKSVDINIAYSIANAGFMDELSGVFLDVFHDPHITFKSIDIAYTKLSSGYANSTVIDLGGITTTMTVVYGGMVKNMISVPMGLMDIEDHITKLFAVHKNRVSSVMNFASDEKLLEHERDEYYRRIELAYRPMGILFEHAVAELRRQVGIVPEPVYVIGIPKWLSVLIPLVQKTTGLATEYVRHADDSVIYAHGTVQNALLSLAIINS